MLGKPHNPLSHARALTEEELEIAQWRVDVTEAGERQINDIYLECWKELNNKIAFSKAFKKAVITRKICGIELKVVDGFEIISSDRQLIYLVNY